MTTVKACSILIQNLKHVHVLLHDTFQYELLQTILKNQIKKMTMFLICIFERVSDFRIILILIMLLNRSQKA